MEPLTILNIVVISLNILAGVANIVKCKMDDESIVGWVCSVAGWFVALLWVIRSLNG